MVDKICKESVKTEKRDATEAMAQKDGNVTARAKSLGAWFRGGEEGSFSRALWQMLVISLLQLTAFAPDEYFQGPEVAHRVVFGYGHLTWEWVAGLRSYLHPMIYAVLYKIASVALPASLVGMVTWWGPYVLHAVVAAWTVVGANRLGEFVFRPLERSGDSFSSLNARLVGWNWFMGYCLTRPYSNSLEAALCTHGLVAYMQSSLAAPTSMGPAGKKEGRRNIATWVLLGVLCVVLRPASGLFWAMLAARALIWPAPDACPSAYRATVLIIGVAGCVVVLVFSTCLDWIMYGRLEVVPWNFLKFNVLEGGSALYGTSPWHANLTMHLPSMLLIAYPAFYYGYYKVWRLASRGDGPVKHLPGGRRRGQEPGGELVAVAQRLVFLGWCALFYCIVYSIPAHKEVRFLLPVLPMCLPVVSYGVVVFGRRRRWSREAFPRYYKWINVAALGYFSIFHQRGPVRVMSVIRRLHDTRARAPTVTASTGGNATMSVLFLTPCHFTPYYASLHSWDIRMRFFDCSPPAYRDGVHRVNAAERGWLNLPGLPSGMSERAYFESDPETVLEDALNEGKPDVVVSLSAYAQLQKHNYTMHWQHWNPADPVQVHTKQEWDTP